MHDRRFTLPTPTRLAATGATVGALALVTLSAGAASAHVTVTPDTTAAGGYAVLTFSVGHGCEGSATTALTVRMPEAVPQVTPTINPGWTVEKVTEQLSTPVTDAHGNELTERVSQVVYTARTPLPDGFRDTVELSLQLPDAEGETLAFPVLQTCEEGETSWSEVAAEGQDADELESPAPTVTISAADADGEHHATGSTGSSGSTDSTGTAETGAVQADGSGSGTDDGEIHGDGLVLASLAAGLGGVALGAVALVRSRKRS